MASLNEYLGFLNTPFLFVDSEGLPFEIFNDVLIHKSTFSGNINNNLRLGNRVEQYVFQQLRNNGYKFIIENLQIIANKNTLGELDCIIEKNNIQIHLEIVFKFYLYNSSVGQSELEHWIGPNKKDSLIEKINKLKFHQLPLLYTPETTEILTNLSIAIPKTQQVFFKAQLFVPYLSPQISFKTINPDCVSGFYISIQDVNHLKVNEFYLPSKEEWIETPNPNGNGFELRELLQKVQPLHKNEKSPMCWMKEKSGSWIKLFITWW